MLKDFEYPVIVNAPKPTRLAQGKTISQELWQEIFEAFPNISFIQIGSMNYDYDFTQDNVIDIREKLPIFEALALIPESKFVLGVDNLLSHASICYKKKGLFMLDAFGGYEAHQLLEERTKHKDFTYVWDQSSFNPITHEIQCYIHFEFSDKTKKKRAFSYSWRLWMLPEIQECLKEAGFRYVDVYMQGWDNEKDEETERFYKVTKCDADPAWVAYLVARK